MQSPKQVFVRTFKFSFVVYGVAMCFLYGTTHGAQQLDVSNLIAALSFVIVILVSFYQALAAEHANHAEWLKQMEASIQQPLTAEFAAKIGTFEKERRTVRINEFV